MDRPKEFKTSWGAPLKPVYGREDVPDSDLGAPGEFPFTRGVHPEMHRKRLWTMRSTPASGRPVETNKRYRFLLEQGQTGLSVAFDLPTQMGYDPDAPMARVRRARSASHRLTRGHAGPLRGHSARPGLDLDDDQRHRSQSRLPQRRIRLCRMRHAGDYQRPGQLGHSRALRCRRIWSSGERMPPNFSRPRISGVSMFYRQPPLRPLWSGQFRQLLPSARDSANAYLQHWAALRRWRRCFDATTLNTQAVLPTTGL